MFGQELELLQRLVLVLVLGLGLGFGLQRTLLELLCKEAIFVVYGSIFWLGLGLGLGLGLRRSPLASCS
jgi:hypothetical protein